MAMNCVVVDIGNTSTSVALARGKAIGPIRRLSGGGHNSGKAISGALRDVARGRELAGAVLSSVVPRVDRIWRAELTKLLGHPPLVVSHKLNLDVSVSYPHPATIGGDRLANACGAVARYGAPVIVADFGTAVTFDVISTGKEYIGGVIAPGLPLMTDYLAEKTALLPHIELRGGYGKVGKSTVTAMRIGARIGYRGMVREIVDYLIDGLNFKDVRLSATGGYARWVLEDMDMPFHFDPDLTLFGLSRIFELNTPGK